MPFQCIIFDINILYDHNTCHKNAIRSVEEFLIENYNIRHNMFGKLYEECNDKVYDEKYKIRCVGDKLNMTAGSILYMINIYENVYMKSVTINEKFINVIKALSNNFANICIISDKEYYESLKILERGHILSGITYLDTSHDKNVDRFDKYFFEEFVKHVKNMLAFKKINNNDICVITSIDSDLKNATDLNIFSFYFQNNCVNEIVNSQYFRFNKHKDICPLIL